MKTFIFSAFCLFLCLWPGLHCDYVYQRMTIHKAPYMAHVMASPKKKGADITVTAIVLDPQCVLLHSEFCNESTWKLKTLWLGVGSLSYAAANKVSKNYTLNQFKINGPLCVSQLGVVPIVFGTKVARAALPRRGMQKPPLKTMVYVGGYGSVRSNEPFPGALHFREAFLVAGQPEDPHVLRLAADAKGAVLDLDASHLGSPVWLPESNLIIGVVVRKKKKEPEHTYVQFLPKYMQWLDETRESFKLY